MSKSLGNSSDPLDLIESYGADALRFTMIRLTPTGQDVLFSDRKVEVGRNFANKVWNATRLALSHLDGLDPARVDWPRLRLETVDRWILSRTDETIEEVTGHLEAYRFNEAARCLYEFTWNEYCDWYLEFAKGRLYQQAGPEREAAQATTWKVLATVVRLLHPFMPFLTEEIWSYLPGPGSGKGLLIREPWPRVEAGRRDPQAVADVQFLREAITAIRNLRSEMNVAPGKTADVTIRCGNRDAGILEAHSEYVRSLARVGRWTLGSDAVRPEAAAAAVVGEAEVLLHLAGAIDVEAEAERLAKELAKVERQAQDVEKKLRNDDFRRKAPPHVVSQEEERLKQLQETRLKLERNFATLKGKGA
jgi:valyl-tRNA synthetase